VSAAQQGDRAAMDRLLRRHYDRIHAVCRRVTGDSADAADAAQDAMIAIVRALPRFDGRSSFSTWAYRIATNASLDELRRRRRRPLLADTHGDSDDVPLEPADPHAVGRLESIVDRLTLDAALLALPDSFRLPVVLRDVADLDYAEIAEMLDVPVGTVKSRIARGRAALAAELFRTSGNSATTSERPSTGS
jgi:RNA polymerase sigma-70 factor, ECF subfamily